MFEFEVIQELEPNAAILEIIKNYEYTVKKERLIDTIEIKRDKNYNIEITNIKFTEEFISKK